MMLLSLLLVKSYNNMCGSMCTINNVTKLKKTPPLLRFFSYSKRSILMNGVTNQTLFSLFLPFSHLPRAVADARSEKALVLN